MKPRVAGIALLLTTAILLAPVQVRGGTVEVRVVDDLDLAAVSGTGAVGLLVPGWGDTVSGEAALEALRSGRVDNPKLDRDRAPAIPIGVPIRAPGVDGDLVILLELPPAGSRPNDTRYPIAVVGDGWSGLLTSPSTRIPGLVSLADIAVTALAAAQQPPPAGTGGRQLQTEASADPISTLATLDRRLSDTRDARLAATAATALILVAFAVAGLLGSGLGGRGALLSIPAAMTVSLVLALAGTSAWWLFALATATLALTAAALARTRLRLGLLIVGAIAFTFVGLAWWSPDVSLSLLGPNPDAGGRFFGLPNELETLLVGATVTAGALLWTRVGSIALMVVGTIGLMTIAPDRLGASTTGAIVLAVAFAVLCIALEGRRGLVPLVVVAAAAVAILALARPQHATGAGPERLLDRFELSAKLAVDSAQSAMLTFVAGLLPLIVFAVLFPRLRGRLERPEWAALLALLVAAPVSLLLNDSPSAVLVSAAAWSTAVVSFGLPRSPSGRPDESYRLAPGWPGSRSSSSPSPRSPSWVLPAGTKRPRRRLPRP